MAHQQTQTDKHTKSLRDWTGRAGGAQRWVCNPPGGNWRRRWRRRVECEWGCVGCISLSKASLRWMECLLRARDLNLSSVCCVCLCSAHLISHRHGICSKECDPRLGRKQPREEFRSADIYWNCARRNEFGSHWSGVEFILGDSLGNLGAELNFPVVAPRRDQKERKRVHDKEISTVEWMLCFFFFATSGGH
jgi:hypothetical protein